jgi:hypothetical protein
MDYCNFLMRKRERPTGKMEGGQGIGRKGGGEGVASR